MKRAVALCMAAVLFGCLTVGCGGNGTSSDIQDSSSDAVASDTESVTESVTESGPETADASSDAEEITSSDEYINSESGDTVTSTPNNEESRPAPTPGNNTTTSTPTGTETSSKPAPTQTSQPSSPATADIDMDAALKPFLKTVPHIDYMPAYDPDSDPSASANQWSGIKALTYDGATINGKKTKVFAYIGFPEGASASSKVPAMVLVHGGGGHAFAEWVKLWNDRGYAAIAMDTTGFFPSEAGKGIAGWESDNVNTLWHYGLYGAFAADGYVNAPNNDEMSSSAKPLDQQWMYHAVSGTMLAQNILAADGRVDTKKIGLCGISWGGTISSIVIGYDSDFAFAVPIYSSGYLEESLGWNKYRFENAITRKLWSAADRFSRVKYPVLWLCWASDTPFSINSNSKSYVDTKAAGAQLTMKVNWGHSHGQGWAPIEQYLFADSVIGKRPKLTSVVSEPTVTKNADGTYNVTMTIAPDTSATKITATAAYITSTLSYSQKTAGNWETIDQTWKASKCTVSGNTVTCTLDKKAKDFFVMVTTTAPDGKYDICSQFIQGLK